MKSILQINAIIELLAGFVLLFNPHLLLNHTNPNIQGIVIAKLYGILAFFFGLVCFILSKHFDYNQLYKQIILSIITFHLPHDERFYNPAYVNYRSIDLHI